MTLASYTHKSSCSYKDSCLCQNLQNFQWNQMYQHFSILDLAVKRWRSTQGRNLNKLWIILFQYDTNQVSLQSIHWFWRRLWRVSTIYGRGGHLGHVNQTRWYKVSFLYSYKLLQGIWFQMTQQFKTSIMGPVLPTKFHCYRPTGSGEEDFEGLYHICAWRQSWSYDTVSTNKLLFPRPMKKTSIKSKVTVT